MVSVNEIVDAMKNLEKDNFREKLAIKENDEYRNTEDIGRSSMI